MVNGVRPDHPSVHKRVLNLWAASCRGQSTTMPDHLPDKLIERMSEHSAKIECAMIRGNFEQVRLIVDQAETDFYECQKEVKAQLNDHINALGIDVRTANYLEELRIFTVYELLVTPLSMIMSVSGISDRTWEYIEAKLLHHGYVHGGTAKKIALLERTGFKV